MLVPKSEADVSETSDWGVSQNKSSALGCCLCTSENIMFYTFSTLFFINSKQLGEISVKGRKSEGLIQPFLNQNRRL